MRIPWPGFIGGSNVSQSPAADSEETINLYVEPPDVPGGKPMLYPTPGVETRVSAAGAPGRAIFHQNGRAFTVIGTIFYEITVDGNGDLVLTNRGSVAVNADPATITGNGEGGGQLFITSGDVGYSYDLTSNILTLERAAGNKMCAMLDGYVLVLDASTSTIYISDLLDVTTWDPTQFAQRSAAPDRWVAMVVPKSAREIWLLGEETSEVWDNAGTFPFPFAPVTNALLPYGCAAPFSARDAGDGFLWLTKTARGQGAVVLSRGLTVTSTFSTIWAMGEYATLSDAIGESMDDRGHTFYLLTFPSEDVTWAFDLTTGIWARRGTWISEQNRFEAWRPRHHAFAFGKHLAVDGVSGTVHEVSAAFGFDADGRPIRRVRQTPTLSRGQERLSISCLELVLDTGLGLPTGQGSDPTVMMRLSRDGGQTWGNERTRTRSAGKIGEYFKRVRWFGCGDVRNGVVEIVVTDPVPFRFRDLIVDIRAGRGD